jgi:PAS domain S-box-containing protein
MTATRSFGIGAQGGGDWPLRWRPFPALLMVFAGYYLGAKVGFALTFSPNPISILWPPNSVLLVALLLAPQRTWPLVLAAAFPAHLLAELQGSVPVAMVLCWFVSNAAEALIGASIVRLLIQRPLKLDNVHEVAVFVSAGVLAAPFLSSFLDAAFVRLNEWGANSYWELWTTRVFSNVLASITLVPVILTVASTDLAVLRGATAGRLLEAGTLAIALLASGVLVFDFDPSVDPSVPLYLPVPFLAWAALRFGVAGASASFAVIAFVTIWGAAHGRGPFTGSSPAESALSVQLFLTFVGITTLTLSAFMHERKRAEQIRRLSEELFATAFQLNPRALAISRASDGRFIEVNQRWLDLFGRQREDFLERTLQEHQVCADEEGRRKLSAVAGKTGEVHEFELDLRHSRGEIIHAVIATRGIEIAGEHCLVITIRDDTDRQRAQAALRDSEAHFRSIADSAPAMIWTADRDQRFTFFSKRWLDFTGRSLEQELGTYPFADVHTDDLDRCRAAYREAFSTGRAFELELRHRRHDGAYRWLLDSGVPRTPGEGRIAGYIGCRTDITERHELQRERQELAHVARVSTMGELAASLAHELNQPLTAILTNVQAGLRMVAADPVDLGEMRALLQDIVEDDHRASEVIRRMRALASKGELELASLDMAKLIKEVAGLVQSDAVIRGVRLSMQVDASLLPVMGDKVQLQQVLLNLLLNAFDAVKDCPPGDRRVALHAERIDGSMMRVAVTDTGTGVADDKLDRIFTPFFTSKRTGLGLGLSISRSIVEAHGGHIRVTNNRDRGATFDFVLPARDSAETPVPPNKLM